MNDVEKLEQKLKLLYDQAQNEDVRHEIYSSGIVDAVIELASKLTNEDEKQIIVMKQFQDIVKNEAELQQILKTSVLYYVNVLLRDSKSIAVQTQCLDLLAWLAQTERCVLSLISVHRIQLTIINLADVQAKQLEDPNFHFESDQIEYTCQLARLVYMMQTISKKAEQLFQQLGISKYFCDLAHFIYQKDLNEQTDKILNITFAVIEKLSYDKKQAEFIIYELKIDALANQILQDQLNKINQGEQLSISDETLLLVLNLLATLCINCPENAQNMLNLDILKTLLQIVITDRSTEITRFSLSCFVEVLYANKGKRYSNILAALRTINDPPFEQLIKTIVGFGRQFHDAETLGVWAILVKMLASVPKRDAYLVEMMIQDKLLTVCMDLMADKQTSLQVKSQVLDCLDMALRIQNLPRDALLEEIPKLVNVTLRLKREFSSHRNRGSQDYQLYLELAERARSVLEKLGHSEGRDNRKFTLFAMAIVGIGMLIGTAINLATGRFK